MGVSQKPSPHTPLAHYSASADTSEFIADTSHLKAQVEQLEEGRWGCMVIDHTEFLFIPVHTK